MKEPSEDLVAAAVKISAADRAAARALVAEVGRLERELESAYSSRSRG